jgi:hypothetical protein
MAERVIAIIGKSATQELRVSIDHFRGNQLLNLRTWFTGADGKMLPGRQGIAIGINRLPELREALLEAEAIARKEGLISD